MQKQLLAVLSFVNKVYSSVADPERFGIRIRKDPGFSNTVDPDPEFYPDPGFYPDPDPYIKKRNISQLVPSIFYEINFFENCK